MHVSHIILIDMIMNKISNKTMNNRTLDWILTALPTSCKVVAAMVKSVRGGSPPPSDHMPVIAVIELKK